MLFVLAANLCKFNLIYFVFSRVDQVHVFMFDRSPTVFLSGFDPAVRSKVTCHDGWSDPLEWNGVR